MEAISPLWREMPLKLESSSVAGRRLESPFAQMFARKLSEAESEKRSFGAAFADTISSAVNAVRETDQERVRMEYLMATGQLDNPALLTIAATRAQLSVELLVQLRNRALDTYNELMRMSV